MCVCCMLSFVSLERKKKKKLSPALPLKRVKILGIVLLRSHRGCVTHRGGGGCEEGLFGGNNYKFSLRLRMSD